MASKKAWKARAKESRSTSDAVRKLAADEIDRLKEKISELRAKLLDTEKKSK